MNKIETVPQWLLEPEISGMGTFDRKMNKKRKNFIVKTLQELSETIQNEFLSDGYSKAVGLIQQLDPRVKLLSFVALIGFAALIRSFTVLLTLYAFTISLLFLSRLPVITFSKRIWMVMPLVTAVMVLPAIFNVIVPGEALVVIYKSEEPISWLNIQLPETLTITRQGITSAMILILRVSISVSLGLILTVTTSWSKLMKGLRLLRVPAIFITMLDMAYRYIFVLINVSVQMFEARKLRTIGNTSYSSSRQFASNAIGVLFTKSMVYSENIYQAMLARGYTGQIETIVSFKLSRLDYIWMFGIMIFILILSVL